MKYPVHILQRNVDVDTIVNMAVIAVMHAQSKREEEA
jgi:phosphotransacetylase